MKSSRRCRCHFVITTIVLCPIFGCACVGSKSVSCSPTLPLGHVVWITRSGPQCIVADTSQTPSVPSQFLPLVACILILPGSRGFLKIILHGAKFEPPSGASRLEFRPAEDYLENLWNQGSILMIHYTLYIVIDYSILPELKLIIASHQEPFYSGAKVYGWCDSRWFPQNWPSLDPATAMAGKYSGRMIIRQK